MQNYSEFTDLGKLWGVADLVFRSFSDQNCGRLRTRDWNPPTGKGRQRLSEWKRPLPTACHIPQPCPASAECTPGARLNGGRKALGSLRGSLSITSGSPLCAARNFGFPAPLCK